MGRVWVTRRPVMARGGAQQELGYVALTPSDLTAEKGYGGGLEYSPGSDSLNSSNITEILNSKQGNIIQWVKPAWSSSDSNTRYIADFGSVKLYWDGANTQWKAEVNGVSITRTDSFSSGAWIYLHLSWDEDAPTLDLTADSTAASQITSAQTEAAPGATLYMGQDSSNANVFNSPISMRISNRIESSFYNSGDGDVDMYVVDAGSVVFNFTDSDTGLHYHPSGKMVSAISNSGTESSLTVPSGGDTSFVENDAVTVSDATGYSKPGFVDGSPTDTNVDVDDGAGALASDMEKVGVSIDGAGAYYTQGGDVLDITTEDFEIWFWMKQDGLVTSPYPHILGKESGPTAPPVRWGVYLRNIGTRVYLNADDDTTAGNVFTNATFDNEWHQYYFFCDRSDINSWAIYEDGVALGLARTGTSPINTLTNSENLTIGAGSGGLYIHEGQLRDVRIKIGGTPSTPTQILFAATHPLDYTLGANGWTTNDGVYEAWELTEGSGTDNAAKYDNANDMVLTNVAAWDTSAFISRNLNPDGGMENGGIGGWTAGDAATTISKSTAQIDKDTQSLKVLNGDGTQAFARQTLTTVANQDYLFRGRFFAPSTPNGASRLVDVDLTAALGITVTQAGLSAGWNNVEFAFQAADTSTTIDLGSGSVTNTEFGYWDDVEVMENLVAQGGCEAADGNALPTGWSDTGSPDADETQTDDAEKHAGATSILLNNCDADEGVTQDVTVVVGEYYTFSVWEKNNAQDVNVVLSGAVAKTIDITGDNSWTQHSYSFKAATTTLTIKVTSGAANQSTWVDDFVLVRNDNADATAVA